MALIANCHIWKKEFEQYQLEIHFWKDHKLQKYQCNQCNKAFTYEHNLKIHFNFIHNGISVSCDFCEKVFAQEAKMKSHVLPVHEAKSQYET